MGGHGHGHGHGHVHVHGCAYLSGMTVAGRPLTVIHGISRVHLVLKIEYDRESGARCF